MILPSAVSAPPHFGSDNQFVSATATGAIPAERIAAAGVVSADATRALLTGLPQIQGMPGIAVTDAAQSLPAHPLGSAFALSVGATLPTRPGVVVSSRVRRESIFAPGAFTGPRPHAASAEGQAKLARLGQIATDLQNGVDDEHRARTVHANARARQAQVMLMSRECMRVASVIINSARDARMDDLPWNALLAIQDWLQDRVAESRETLHAIQDHMCRVHSNAMSLVFLSRGMRLRNPGDAPERISQTQRAMSRVHEHYKAAEGVVANTGGHALAMKASLHAAIAVASRVSGVVVDEFCRVVTHAE
jgi:hypothetical protein